MTGQKYKWKATAMVSFPYHFEPLIFETSNQAKEDTIKDIKENICCVSENEIEISDLKVEKLGPISEAERKEWED